MPCAVRVDDAVNELGRIGFCVRSARGHRRAKDERSRQDRESGAGGDRKQGAVESGPALFTWDRQPSYHRALSSRGPYR